MILAIIMAIENDDDRAFLLMVYSEYYDLMKRKARIIVKDEGIAEDMLQETILKLIPHVSMLRTLKKNLLVSYICKTINSVSIDYYRKHLRKESKSFFADESDLILDIEDASPPPMDHYERIETYSELGQTVMKLSLKDQHILYYKYNLGYSDKKIAKLMGIEYGNLRVALLRAKNRLRKLLLREGLK